MSMQTNKNNSNNSKIKTKKSIKECNYCKRKRHIESKCFKKNPSLKKNSINTTKEEEQILASSIKSNNYNNIDFILDSSATIHTCYIKELFTSLKPSSTSIK